MFDAMGDVESAFAKLAASEQPLDVVRLHVLRNRFEALWLRAVDDYNRAEDWVDEGFANAASALRVKCSIEQGVANASVRLGRKLHQLPVVAEAFAAGEISRQHVQAVADACTPERAPAIGQLEEAIVDAARATTPRVLGQVMSYITDALDGDDGASRANAQHARRRLHISRTLDGMVAGDFLLDPESGEIVISAIRTAEGRFRSDHVREPAQRRAEALVDVCRAGAAQLEDGPSRARPSADITMHIGLAEIEARGGPELAIEIRANAPNLPKATLRRITCDARISRVITDGRSEVLDVGRSTRTIPIAMWRALVARDRGCSHPLCDRPAAWCDGHHVVHWADGGETKLENLRLLCRRHHRMVHEGGHDPP